MMLHLDADKYDIIRIFYSIKKELIGVSIETFIPIELRDRKWVLFRVSEIDDNSVFYFYSEKESTYRT